jgi:hypothetical protein
LTSKGGSEAGSELLSAGSFVRTFMAVTVADQC